MKLRHILISSFLLFFIFSLSAATSVAGFYQIKGSGRQVYNFNLGWRFHRGDIKGAEKTNFDDSSWDIVATPHTVELMPAEASGCRNYQGIAWYRKRFVIPESAKGMDVTLRFEAIMGKQKIYLNGKLVNTHFGGYLPINVDLTGNGAQAGDTCELAVMADNSDDKSYPPGKPQYMLDFCYHGGIYRDVWMICKNKVAITDAIQANEVAGGGVFVHYDHISQKSAEVFVNTEIKNSGKTAKYVTLEACLNDSAGKTVRRMISHIWLKPGTKKTIYQKTTVLNPQLWGPYRPYLYHLNLLVKEGKKNVDGGMVRIGIRDAEFRGKDGFYLNGKPFGQIIGGNRHQDFAYVGNAVPNSQQWRDVKRLRDAGDVIVRTAHYPQDPAFMDACDELGMFIIVATPGWQFWNKAPIFAQRVYQNTRQIIRRDRNHPCVLLWEPILNETRFPLDFSLKSLQITKDEFPYPGRPGAAGDLHSPGIADHYDVVYGWPTDEGKVKQSIFTREFGEDVDDWYAHNADNRASRSWGERPMIVQALSLAKSYDAMFKTTGQFTGGAQWHPFDHQRGYHPDPYWGGIFDAFRQPKYSYYMFKSQVNPNLKLKNIETGPMVYIANEFTPFSGKDVVVFSNCDSVRLTAYGTKTWTLPVVHAKGHMPNPPVIFKNVYYFKDLRHYTYDLKDWKKVTFVAEGIINGKVVCREKKMPSRRSTKIRLRLDDLGKPLVADGSDFIVVIAEITDNDGNVRRLAKDNIKFEVSGQGRIIGNCKNGANPRAVEWGSAPLLVQSTNKAGKIRVIAHVEYPGIQAPSADTLVFSSVPYDLPFNYIKQYKKKSVTTEVSTDTDNNTPKTVLTEAQKQKILKEVEQQQTDFGEKKK